MADKSMDIQSLLSSQDEEFQRLAQEHHRYEDRLAELAHKTMLTPEEELEEKQLKKRKLYIKDEMAAKIRSHSSSQQAQA
ncbi:MAG TPA: DUF465 domain-containing protein [Thermoanaerobaculia bacterium]|nr:DUF465 domain-containing protein [Thermoanaerobaculia bacterium]